MADTSLIFNLIGKDQISKVLGNVGDSADGLGSKMASVAKVGALALAGGIAAVGAAAVDFAKSAMEDAASASALQQTMQKTQGATKSQVKATEDWISSMGVAYGVADDKLRPALASLMIAGRTTAQSQADVGVAMDIAAAKGVDLESVTNAMAKAAMGNTGALGKLGIATKDASGKALTYDEVLKNASKTMGGAAADAANTTAGKFARVSLVISELKESIGYALLPVLTNLATFFMDKVMPAASQLADSLVAKLGPAVTAISAWVMGTLVPALSNLWSWFVTKILPGIQSIVGIIIGAWQSAFSSIGGAINEHRAQLETLWGWLQNIYEVIATKVFPVLAVVLGTALKVVGEAIGIVIGIIAGMVSAGEWLAGAISSAAGGVVSAFNWVKDTVIDVKNWIVNTFNEIVGFVTGLPDRIASAASGMWDGIKNAFRSAVNWIIDGWNRLEFTLPEVDTHIPGVGKIGGWTLGTPNIPRLAEGALIKASPGRGILANIGEGREDEAVMPLSKLDAMVNRPTPPTVFGGGVTEVHNHFHMEGMYVTDPRGFIDELTKALRNGGGSGLRKELSA